MWRATPLVCGVLSLLSAAAAPAEALSLDTAPPAVVQTVPAAGAQDVDPGLDRISVTFSKDMQPDAWSWVIVDSAQFPKMDGPPVFRADQRTCELPVQLEPGRTYALWLNSAQQRDFKDRSGRPAVPYLLVFKTRFRSGGSTARPVRGCRFFGSEVGLTSGGAPAGGRSISTVGALNKSSWTCN